MKHLKKVVLLAAITLFSGNLFGQYLPETFQPILSEIVTHFETIRIGNSLTEGETSIRVINDSRVVLRVEHKRKIKNLTFIKKTDEENQLVWVSANQLTTDMVNKYKDYLEKTLRSMHKLSEKKSKE